MERDSLVSQVGHPWEDCICFVPGDDIEDSSGVVAAEYSLDRDDVGVGYDQLDLAAGFAEGPTLVISSQSHPHEQ